MKMRHKLAAALLLALGSAASAQDYYDPGYAYEFAPRTGDPLFDELLYQINGLVADDRGWYVDDIVRSTGAPRYYVEPLIIERRYAPADVYMIGEAARVSGKSFATVQREFDANRGQGWGVVAMRLGIKPGSAAFHRLKNGAGTWSSHVKTKVKGKGVERVATRPAHSKAKVKPGKGQGKLKEDRGGKGKAKGKDKDR